RFCIWWRSGRVAWAVMRWVACSISASTAESDTICQGQTGQDRTVGAGARRPIRSFVYIVVSPSQVDRCARARPGSQPGRARFVCGEGLLLLVVLVVLLGSAEGLVVNPLAVDHGVLERVRSAVVHDSADDGVFLVATHLWLLRR